MAPVSTWKIVHWTQSTLTTNKTAPDAPNYCPEGTISVSSRFLGCARTNQSQQPLPTGCNRNTLVYPQSTLVCTGTKNCGTLYVQNTVGDDTTTTWFNCVVDAGPRTLYRTTPANTSATTTSRSTSTTESNGPTPTPSPKGSSNAWIAGAVIGSVVGLALIGLLASLAMRLRKKNKDKQAEIADGGIMTSVSNGGDTSKLNGQPRPHSEGYQSQFAPSPNFSTPPPLSTSPPQHWTTVPQELEAEPSSHRGEIVELQADQPGVKYHMGGGEPSTGERL